MWRLVGAALAAMVVGLMLMFVAIAVTESPHVAAAAFFVGVTLTLGWIMKVRVTPAHVAVPSAPIADVGRADDANEQRSAAADSDSADDADDAGARDADDNARHARAAYLRTVRESLSVEPKQSNLVLIVLSVVFLGDMLRAEADLTKLAILVGVLLLHEAGHFVGMKLFGYRDLRVFFIPGFGAATSGRSSGAPRWQEGIVLLLGPLPGLLIGVALIHNAPLSPPVAQLAVMLVLINALNLLPLGVLDGGKLVHLVLFSRRRALEVPFLVCASVGLIALAYSLESWLLGVAGGLALITAPHTAKVGRMADELRARRGALGEITALPDDDLDALYTSARASLPASPPPPPATVAAMMRTLHDLARAAPVTAGQSAALFAAYAGAAALAAVTVVPMLRR